MDDDLDRAHLSTAIEEAKKGFSEGGIPIGSVIAIGPDVIGAGHNRRVQEDNPILHAEMDALQDAGRLSAQRYRQTTLYTTLSPCHMCTGAVLLYGIPRVVIGESKTFRGPEELLKRNGVKVMDFASEECIQMMREFISARPDLWNEDIGADRS